MTGNTYHQLVELAALAPGHLRSFIDLAKGSPPMCSCPAHTALADCACNCDHSGDRISQWKAAAKAAEAAVADNTKIWDRERRAAADLLSKWQDRALKAEDRLKPPTPLSDGTVREYEVSEHKPGCMRPNPHYGPCLNAEGIERLALDAAATRHVSLSLYNLTPGNLPRAIRVLSRAAVELAVEGFDITLNAGTLDGDDDEPS